MKEFPPFLPYEDVHAGSWAFVTFASRVSPRNLCLSCIGNRVQQREFTYVLKDVVSAWPLINIGWHWVLHHSPPLVLKAHYHLFGDTLSADWMFKGRSPYKLTRFAQESGVRSITYNNRSPWFQYHDHTAIAVWTKLLTILR